MSNPFPAGSVEAHRWDELQYTIDTIREDYPVPVRKEGEPDELDPLDAHPALKKRLAEARAQQNVMVKLFNEASDAGAVKTLDAKLDAWRKKNPKPRSK